MRHKKRFIVAEFMQTFLFSIWRGAFRPLKALNVQCAIPAKRVAGDSQLLQSLSFPACLPSLLIHHLKTWGRGTMERMEPIISTLSAAVLAFNSFSPSIRFLPGERMETIDCAFTDLEI